MLFDSHAHYDDERFDEDREALIKSLPANGVSYVLNAGCDLESSYKSADLAKAYDFFYASAGVHPHSAKDWSPHAQSEIAALTERKKVVAIGEIGLDYYYDNSPREAQKACFADQLELARALDLPVIIHSRDATQDTMALLHAHPVKAGVLHCFSGSVETAKQALQLGYYISFAGPVTFKNAKNLLEVAAYVPADRYLIETDAPYLAPEPYRGKRNCSIYVKQVAQKLAGLRGLDLETVAAQTQKNAKTLFGI